MAENEGAGEGTVQQDVEEAQRTRQGSGGGSDDSVDHADQDRREQGDTEGPMEDELEQAFDRQVEQGVQRLSRSWREILATGFVAGTDIAFGVIAFVLVMHETGNQLLAAIAFAIGPLALMLGRSELFTEGFLVPVVTVAAKKARPAQLAKLWSGTLVANLVGGWLIMWLIVLAFPGLERTMIDSAAHYATAPLSVETFCLSLLGGMVMTLLTRMQQGTEEMVVRVVASIAAAFLLVGLQLFHSVLNSLLVFGALHTGQASFGYVDWLVFFSYSLVGNIIGGLGLVTLLRLVRSKDKLQDERREEEAAGRA